MMSLNQSVTFMKSEDAVRANIFGQECSKVAS